jgi:hypothetical protein
VIFLSKIDSLVKEIEALELDEQKELFNRLEDLLDLLGWFKLYDVKIM